VAQVASAWPVASPEFKPQHYKTDKQTNKQKKNFRKSQIKKKS
jgi:hypothetical protein